VHRIRYFKRNEDIVWDRRTKLDKVFFWKRTRCE
jgi:hypothetical protein